MSNKTIREVFWENVTYLIELQGFTPFKFLDHVAYNQYTAKHNLTLETCQKFADLLDIDDYSILFEQVEEHE